MNWYNELINLFKTLYSRFRRQYTDYLKKNGTKYYVAYANVTLKVPSNRIPYYQYHLPAFQRSTPTGNLPANLDPYYLKEVPVWVYSGLPTFLNMVESNMVAKSQAWNAQSGVDVRIGQRQLAVSALDVQRKSLQLQFTPFINKAYRRVLVNYDPALMDVEIHVVRADTYFNRVLGGLFVQEQLDKTLKSVEIAYNRGVQLMTNPNLPAAQKEIVKSVLGSLQSVIVNLKNNPEFTVKVCADCNGNSRIGLPIVPILLIALAGGISWGAIYTYSTNRQKARESAERLATIQSNADRISAATAQMLQVLTNSTLTDAQKRVAVDVIKGEITNAQGATGDIIKQAGDTNKATNVGFMDRIENLILLAGGIYIVGNMTKK